MTWSRMVIYTVLVLLLQNMQANGQRQLNVAKGLRSIAIKQGTNFSYINLKSPDKIKTDKLVRITNDSVLILQQDTVDFHNFILIRKNPFVNLLALGGATFTTLIEGSFTGVIFFLESYGAALCDDDCDMPFWETHPNTLLMGSITMINGLAVYRGINRLQKPKVKEEWEYDVVLVKNPERFRSKNSFWFWQKTP
ncbi:MAG: hypothetical protein JXQ87_12895 [Bacteroidia bacterium]